MQRLLSIIKWTAVVLFALIIAFLAIHSLFFTSEMKSTETIRNLADQPLVHLATIGLIVTAAVVWLRRGDRLTEKTESRLNLLVMFLLLAGSSFCVLVSKSIPIFDQHLCISAANALARGDYSQSLQYYYLNYFPFQLPLILFLSLLSLLGGAQNVMVFQFANVAANLVSVWALGECGVLIFHDRKMRLYVRVSALLFLPLSLYVPFVYGNLFGLCFMLLGARALLLYMEKPKARHLAAVVVFFALACLMKKNYIIASCAALLLLLWHAVEHKRLASALAALLVAVTGYFGGSAVQAVTSAVTGIQLAEGFPMSSWVMLGLQEEEGHEPGWYNENGYAYYCASGLDTQVTRERALQSIRERLAIFREDPAYAASFLYRKTISQWEEPSFQSLWVNEMARNPQRGWFALSLYERGKIGNAALWWMNQYHSIVLMGTLLWVLLCMKKHTFVSLFFTLYFIGGFLFHLVWEAKGQYTLFYFFGLLPYAVTGYLALARRVNGALNRVWRKRRLHSLPPQANV